MTTLAKESIAAIHAWEYAIPLRMPAPVSERRGLVLEWQTTAGRLVRSEIAPLPGFSPESLDECRRDCQAWLERAPGTRELEELSPVSLSALPPAARFGIEAGRLQLLHDLPAAQPIEPCALIDPSLAYESRDELAELDSMLAAIPAGLGCLKVKVGRDTVDREAAILRHLDKRLPARVKLRLDANRAWSLEQARQVCAAIPAPRVDYVEEPLVPGSNYADWAAAVAVPFAWDETLREQPELDLLSPGLEALVVKPMLTGVAQTLGWLEAAHVARRRVVLSAAFESNLSLDLYARLAAQWQLCGYHGLDTFAAWPGCLLEPLRSQPAHSYKPLFGKDRLFYLGRWL